MPRIVREAELTWQGSVARGSGTIGAASSGAFTELPFSLPSRVARTQGKTSPEELLAGAHGACFGMSLANELGQVGVEVERLELRCTITMDEVVGQGHEIVHSAIAAAVTGTGIDDAVLEAARVAADEGCPFSRMLKAAGAGVEITATRGG